VPRFFFSSRRRHTRSKRDWSSDVCSSDLTEPRVMQLASAQDVFTNTVKPAATQARVTIIVLDTLNTMFFDLVTARREILKFLSRSEERRVGKGGRDRGRADVGE